MNGKVSFIFLIRILLITLSFTLANIFTKGPGSSGNKNQKTFKLIGYNDMIPVGYELATKEAVQKNLSNCFPSTNKVSMTWPQQVLRVTRQRIKEVLEAKLEQIHSFMIPIYGKALWYDYKTSHNA